MGRLQLLMREELYCEDGCRAEMAVRVGYCDGDCVLAVYDDGGWTFLGEEL